MNYLVIVCVLVGSSIADDYSTPKYGYGGGGYGGYGSVGHGHGQVGHLLGGNIFGNGGGGMVGGGPVGGVGGPGSVGGVIGGGTGGRLPAAGFPKYGSCPFNSVFDPLELGPFCSHDDDCHGVQKCCPVILNGNRCQIPREYQKPGSCNTNYDLSGWVRRACNDDTTCPYGKCCKRFSSGQVDTCTYQFPGPIPGGHGIPGGLGPVYPIPHLPGQGSHGYGPTYPKQSKVY